MIQSQPWMGIDRYGNPWFRTGMVRGECDQHWFPTGDTSGYWEGGEVGPPDSPYAPKQPTNVPQPTSTAMRGLSGCTPCLLSGVDEPAPTWRDSECSLPTLRGIVVFGAIGALAARRGRRVAGAMDGVFGSWLGCAAARAMGLSDTASSVLTFAGAFFSARIYEGR